MAATPAPSVLIVPLAGIFLLPASFGAAQTLPACTADQKSAWHALQGDRMGAEGFDEHSVAVHGIAKRFFGGRNWYPVSDERETVCGRFSNSKLFSVFVDPAEYDWNIFIAPAAAYKFSIDKNLLPMPAQIGTCPGSTTEQCLEVEVGARKNHFSNAFVKSFLPKNLDESLLIGHGVCVAGPWVQDENHDNHPEIHPAEQIWWRYPATVGPLHLLAVQDASERFKDDNDYEFEGAKPPQFRTWTTEPSRARFRIALAHADGAPPARYALDHLGSTDVKDNPQFDTGDLSIMDASTKRLEVVKESALRSRVKLETEFACRDADRVLAIAGASVAPGDPGTGNNAGYLLLRVRQLPAVPTPPAPQSAAVLLNRTAAEPTQPEVEVRIAPGTLRVTTVDGRRVMVADLELRTGDTDGRVTGARIMAPSERQLETQAGSGRVVARGVPVSTGARIELSMSNGLRPSVELPEVVLVATIKDPQPAALVPAPEARASFARESGLWPSEESLPGDVRRVTKWRLEALPEYGVRKEGRIAAEEESAATKALADVMRAGRAEDLRRVFGRTVPVTASWAAATAPPVAPRELSIEPDDRPAPLVERGAVGVPTPTDVQEVAAIRTTLRLTDSLGGTAEAERTVWTHVLEGPNAAVLLNRVLQRLATLTAIPLDVLEGGGPRGSSDRRHGSIVRTAATRATADNRLSIDECRSLVVLADGIRKARAGAGNHP